MERAGGRRDGGERACFRSMAGRRSMPLWRRRAVGRLGRRRVAAAVRDAAEPRRCERLGRRAAVELPRLAVERRELLLPLVSACERRGATRRPGAWRHTRRCARRRLSRCVHAALRVQHLCGRGWHARRCVVIGARSVRRRVAARVYNGGARAGERVGAAVDERPAVRAERRRVRLPAVRSSELRVAVERGVRGRHATHSARCRLLFSVGGARAARVPDRAFHNACDIFQCLCNCMPYATCHSGLLFCFCFKQRQGLLLIIWSMSQQWFCRVRCSPYCGPSPIQWATIGFYLCHYWWFWVSCWRPFVRFRQPASCICCSSKPLPHIM